MPASPLRRSFRSQPTHHGGRKARLGALGVARFDSGPPFPMTFAVRTIRIARRLVPRLVVLALLAVAATMFVPPVLGLDRYVITGGSMSGTYDFGSVVFAKTVPVKELEKGDVITYAPPAGKSPDELVTHRIVGIRKDKSGELSFRTKGDANKSADPWTFTLDSSEQSRVVHSLPYVGYGLIVLSHPVFRVLVLGLPALLIGLLLVARLWHEAGVEASRRRKAAA